MGTVPTLAQVRAYVHVPATVLSDEDLERMRAACLEDQTARCHWPGLTHNAVALTVDDMTVTVAVRGGTVGRAYIVSWAAGVEESVTADDNGDASAEHTYTEPGPANVWVRDGETGETVGAAALVLPDQSASANVSYPDALAQALLRRIQREIAARNLPLGMVGLDAAEYGPQRLPTFDALIESHEHAFRRVVLA